MMEAAEKRRYDVERKREGRWVGTDISKDLKPVVDAERKSRCRHSLLEFLTTYDDHSATFRRPFGQCHLDLIKQIESCILSGGQFVTAMPRGSGKTTIMMRSVIWSALCGHSPFTMLVCSDQKGAQTLFRSIVTVLQNSALLLEDFPEVLVPVRDLQGAPQRGPSQTINGEKTNVRISMEQGLILPDWEGSRAAGNASAIIKTGSMGGSLRGQVVTTPDGRNQRPTLALVDDPQTRASAKSKTQVQDNEDLLKGDIVYMGGTGEKMSVLVACTAIYDDDLACRLLDVKRSPGFQIQKVRTLESFPEDMDSWSEYWNLHLKECYGEIDRGSANDYYAKRKKTMDRGAVVYWEAAVADGQLSAIQTAMHDYLSNPRAFLAERQNEPDEVISGELHELKAGELIGRQSTCRRGVVPAGTDYLVCHIDVQLRALYWVVAAFKKDGMGGAVVDFGCYPEQKVLHFQYAEIAKRGETLQMSSPENDEQGAIRAGIVTLIERLSARQWPTESKQVKMLDRGLVDGGYKTDVVESALLAAKTPSWHMMLGAGIKATSPPLKLRKPTEGIFGFNWIMQPSPERLLPLVHADVNYWKTQAHAGLCLPVEHGEAFVFPSDDFSALQILADHCVSETSVRCEAKGKVVDEWQLKGNSRDNHLWDNIVGCYVAANMAGSRKRSTRNEQKTRRETFNVGSAVISGEGDDWGGREW